MGSAGSVQAYNDFLLAYAALASQPCDRVLTGTLAGVTLRPGVYCFAAAATLTGTLTLGGGDPCNVTWWVAQAATMTDSQFVGTILAARPSR